MKTKKLFCLIVAIAAIIGFATHVRSDENPPTNSTEAILKHPGFREGLVWIGTEPSQQQSDRLLLILQDLKKPVWRGEVEKFLNDYPDSPWAASLHHVYACFCQRTGRTTKALDHWEAGWKLVKDDTSVKGRRLGGAILANWMDQLSSLGRHDKLKELIAAGDQWQFVNHQDREKFLAAKNAYHLMGTHPEMAFRCGTLALKAVGQMLQPTNQTLENLVNVPSPSNGFSVAALEDMANKYGLNLVAEKRTKGRDLIVPSIVHWRQNHYAAIIGQTNDQYRVIDPTFGKPRWMPAEVINEEASGIFLVPATTNKPGWTRLAESETLLVRGMGIPAYVSDGKDKGCITVAGGAQLCNCAGMPVWWMSEPYINLWIGDEPISYLTSRGEKFGFRLSYKQRDTRTTGMPGIPYTVPTAGWNHSWWSSLQIIQTSTESDATLYMANGGEASFTPTQLYDPENRIELLDASQNPVVIPDSGGGYYQPGWGFRVVHADGTQDLYEILADVTSIDGDFTIADFLQTRTIDPNGNTTSSLNYILTNGQYVLTSLVDYDGRTNTFGYTYISANENNVLTSITNAYGKTAFFKYDTNADLTNIVDAQGISSSLTYDTNGYPTSLITPYGTNTFVLFVGAEVSNTNNGGGNFGGDEPPYVDRAALITDPTGENQLYLYQYDCVGFMATNYPSTAIPASTPIGTLDTGTGNTNTLSGVCYRNSFYWNQRQYAALSTNSFTNLVANDYLRGRMRHWLQDTNVTITVTGQLSAEQAPSPDGTNGGLLTFYDYQGKPQNYVAGNNPLPSVIAWRIPGGDTHYEYDQYDYFGNITNQTTTYTEESGHLGTRSFQFIYADNTYTNALSNSDTNGNFVNWATNYFTVPNLLVRVVDPYSSNIWQCAGFDGISWTNKFGSTNWEEVLSSQRVLPRYWTNEINQTIAFTFTNFNRITSIQWPSGLTTTNIYNSGGFLDHTTDIQINRTRGFVYSTNGMPSTYTNELGLVFSVFWDNLLRPAGASFPDGTTISNVYTALDVTSQKDRLGHWTSFGYDGLRHLTSITRTNDGNVTNTTTLVWCGCGALTDIYDALTNHTAFGYDYQSRLTSIEFPDTSSISYLYDLSGRMTNAMDGEGAYLRYSYNHQGLITNVNNNYGMIFQMFSSDALDRPMQIIGNNNVVVSFDYDGLNRVVDHVWQDLSEDYFVYSTNGLASYQDQNGNTTYFGRDVAGRLTSLTNANTNITQFAYDPAGNVTNLIDGLMHNTGLGYNQFSWLTSIADNSGNQSFRFYYDANGELTNRWTPGTTNTTYTYDSLGNPKSISYPGAANPTASISFAYDVLNRLTNMVDGVGTTSRTYTSNSFPASETGPWANTGVAYLYNQQHRINLALTSPASTLNFSNIYDTTWRLQSLVSPEGAFAYTYATLSNYSLTMPSFAPGLVSSITLPNAALITNQYGFQSRLTNTALQNYWGHVLDGYSYTYDEIGQRTSMTRNLGITTNIVTNIFDSIGQLTSWSGQESGGALRFNEQLSFGYDAAQNLTNSLNNGFGQTFIVNALNELSTVSRSGVFTLTGNTPAPSSNVWVNGTKALTNGDLTFAATNISLSNGANTFTIIATNNYGVAATNILVVSLPSTVTFQNDTNGNSLSDGTRYFVYDAENQLTNIYVTNQWMTQFGYDGLRRRRIERDFTWNGSTWVKTNEVHTVFDGVLPVQERDTNSNVLVTYTRGQDLSGSIMGAGGIGGLLARTDANGPAFYHADGAGNITALIDENQNIVARYEYDPFLRPLGIWGSLGSANIMRGSSMPNYNGGIIGFWGRTFDTVPRRWLSPDPIGLVGGLNPYPFVGNRPVNFIDPLGLEGNPLSSTLPGLTGAWNPNPDGPGGSFYSPGYAYNPPPWFPYPVPTYPAPYPLNAWDPNKGQWYLSEQGLQSDPVMDTLMFGIGGALRGSAFKVCSPKSFGKLGTVVPKPALKIAGFTEHGLDQAITRGVSPPNLLSTVENPSVVLQQSAGQYLFISDQAAVVLNPAGQVITTYPASMFGANISAVLNAASPK